MDNANVDDKKESVVFDDYCIDLLKEVGHICTGNATVALSQVIKEKIDLRIPDLKLVDIDQIAKTISSSQEVLVGVSIHLLGNMSGNVVLMFPEKSAYSLIDCISQYPSELGSATEYGVSSLKEIGNIVISAYLATLSTFTKTIILFSTPNLVCGTLDTIFNIAFAKMAGPDNKVLLIDTFFSIPEKNIDGSFFLVFDPVAVKKIIADSRPSGENGN
ncbi:MAG: chemotaxis protein CheC [Candidatus Omnitrophica bacterium]|nr:chemotaxis protein CheC [Candidatus Omnitrophota bacterium]